MKKFEDCLIAAVYAILIVFVVCAIIWAFQASRLYYNRQMFAPRPAATDAKLFLPFKVKPEQEEFRLGEVYIDKQGYLRQKKGE